MNTAHAVDHMIEQNEAMQQRFWDELGKAREEYERMIHTELRLMRQKTSLAQTAAQVVQSAPS